MTLFRIALKTPQAAPEPGPDLKSFGPADLAMRRRPNPLQWSAGASALILSLAFTTAYYLTRTADYSVDAVRVASDISYYHRSHDLTSLLHPGYLLYCPLVLGCWRIARLFGAEGPLSVMQIVNCVAGGVGIGVFSLLLRSTLTRSRALTVLIPMALAVSFGYWLEATDARPEMPATALGLTAVYLMVRAMLLPTRKRVIYAGLASTGASLLHLFWILLIPIGVVAICLAGYTEGSEIEERAARRSNVIVFLVAAAAPVTLAYVSIGTAALRLWTGDAWRAWFRTTLVRDWWYSPHPIDNLRLDAYALRRALFVEPGGKSGTFHLAIGGTLSTAVLIYWTALAAWFVALYGILSSAAFLLRTHYRPVLTIALLMALSYAAFFTVISPGLFFNWVPVIIASAIITAVACAYYRGRRGGPIWLVLIGLWTVLFGASNYIQFIGPHRSPKDNPNLQQAMQLSRQMRPGDLYVASGLSDDTAVCAYLPYFGNRTVFSLRDSLIAHDGQVNLTARDLDGAIAKTEAGGGNAYASGQIWTDETIRARILLICSGQDPQGIFVGLSRVPAWHDPYTGSIVWKLLPQ